MTKRRRVVKVTSSFTHSSGKVVVPDSEFKISNLGKAQMLIDPEDYKSGKTHSSNDLRINGPKKAPIRAALHDFENQGPVNLHDVDNSSFEVGDGDFVEDEDLYRDPALPVIEVPAAVEIPEDEEDPENTDEEFSEIESSMDDDEFSDLPSMDGDLESSAEQEFSDLNSDKGYDSDEAEYADDNSGDTLAILDTDEVPDDGAESENLQFASIGNKVHAIRLNRIIASMGVTAAKRAEASDIYLTPQFQDVVVANVEKKGLRKGLVQSGFVLSTVKISSASSSTKKVVSAKVQEGIAKKVALFAQREKAMEQSLAIAAVGINRRFFKDTTNELKSSLEQELVQLGVRGGQNLVRAMFAKHGVSYAKSILTLANKIAAMPQEMRDGYVDALDMTDDGEDFEENYDDLEGSFEEGNVDEMPEDDDIDQFDHIPASTVSAALRNPNHGGRKVGALLSAGVKSSAAMSILNGSQSLV